MTRARVSIDDLSTAAEWLDCNEGDSGEAESCKRVAKWLAAEVERRTKQAAIRHVARERGVSPKAVRAALAKKGSRP